MNEIFSYKDIQKAMENIKKYVYTTPMPKSVYLSDKKRNVYLKLENQQEVKAFKVRGALNKILSLTEEEKNKGVITVSSGNHGIATSYAANLLGIKNAYIIVPETTPKSKTDKIEFYGGTVKLLGKDYDAAHREGMKLVKEKGMTYIDPWDEDEVVYMGQGTISIEIFKQCKNIDTIFVPIGGGGLITGIAVGAKGINPNVKIIGVQTEACPAYKSSIDDNILYNEYESKESLCDALIGGIGHLAFKMKDVVDEVVLVSESSIKEAVKYMALKEKQIVEPSSATVVAAYIKKKESLEGKNIALVVSGGNIDDNLFINMIK